MAELSKDTIVALLGVAIGRTIALGYIAWLIIWAAKEIIEAVHLIFALFVE